MNNNDYQIVDHAPTLEEYRTLCSAVGWEKAVNFDAAPVSLAHSIFHTLAVYNDVIIGMGRIIGDSVIYFICRMWRYILPIRDAALVG